MLGGKWLETCSFMAVNPGKSDDPPKEGDGELQQRVEAALERVLGTQLAPGLGKTYAGRYIYEGTEPRWSRGK